MKTQHTPGPWEAIGTLVHAPVMEGFGIVVDCEFFSYRKTDKMCIANARLIAAAPDLLAACEQALKLQCLNSDHLTDEEIHIGDLLLTVIRKSKGE